MGAPVRGIDVSSWQHPEGAAIDWEKVRKSEIAFVIVKASQGTSYVSPWLARDLSDARAEGLLVGAYHFYSLVDDAAEQAKYFAKAVAGEVLDMGTWLDFEPGAMASFAASQAVQAFIEAIKPERPGCGLYVDQSWLSVLKETNTPLPRLWVTNWGKEGSVDGAFMTQDYPGSVAGIVGNVDIDWLWAVRGINIPTAPGPSRVVASVHPVKLPEVPDHQGDDDDGGDGEQAPADDVSQPS